MKTNAGNGVLKGTEVLGNVTIIYKKNVAADDGDDPDILTVLIMLQTCSFLLIFRSGKKFITSLVQGAQQDKACHLLIFV